MRWSTRGSRKLEKRLFINQGGGSHGEGTVNPFDFGQKLILTEDYEEGMERAENKFHLDQIYLVFQRFGTNLKVFIHTKIDFCFNLIKIW